MLSATVGKNQIFIQVWTAVRALLAHRLLIAWCTRWQKLVVQSTSKAEYIAISEAMHTAVGISNMPRTIMVKMIFIITQDSIKFFVASLPALQIVRGMDGTTMLRRTIRIRSSIITSSIQSPKRMWTSSIYSWRSRRRALRQNHSCEWPLSDPSQCYQWPMQQSWVRGVLRLLTATALQIPSLQHHQVDTTIGAGQHT